jgi:hypothetical protein
VDPAAAREEFENHPDKYEACADPPEHCDQGISLSL